MLSQHLKITEYEKQYFNPFNVLTAGPVPMAQAVTRTVDKTVTSCAYK